MDFAIQIPLLDRSSFIKFFPDELPDDFDDVIDVLRSELAPLKSWRQCAVEYFRQGNINGFDAILGEIEKALQEEELELHFQKQTDFQEHQTEIFVALAARQLLALALLKTSGAPAEQIMPIHKKCVDYIKKADEKMRTHEYLMILKGFFEIIQGDPKRANDCFQFVSERAAKTQLISKKKYLFAALIGLGIAACATNNPKAGAEHFSRAITSHPACDASVRTALACCCFKLEQYDRAKQALLYAGSLCVEVPQLLLWALIKLVEANKDRTHRLQLRQTAFDFAYLAYSLDPYNASALNLLANHRFYAWQSIEVVGLQWLSPDRLTVREDAIQLVEGLKPGNLVRLRFQNDQGNSQNISSTAVHTVTEVVAGAEMGSLTVRVSPPFLSYSASKTFVAVEVRHLHEVADLAKRALSVSGIKPVRAESYYILGKVAHAQGDAQAAYRYYGQALTEASDMALAAFGAAQILFAGKEFDKALDLFESVLRTPAGAQDKDTRAYVALLRGMLRGTIAPLRTLRDCAPGFQFESDLWLSQAQLRHRKADQHHHSHQQQQKSGAVNGADNGASEGVVDYSAALECYSFALDCLKARGQVAPSAVLNNLGVLYFVLQKREKALDCFAGALAQHTSLHPRPHLLPFLYRGLDDTDWTDRFHETAQCEVVPAVSNVIVGGSSPFTTFSVVPVNNGEVQDDTVDFVTVLRPGDLVLIGNAVWTVESINSSNEITCSLPCPRLLSSADPLPLRIRGKVDLALEDSPGLAYNVARALEEVGQTSTAATIYHHLLRCHPSCLDAYLRLSAISRTLGDFDAASTWLQRANRLKEDSVEVATGLGDIYLLMGQGEDAKKTYEKIYLKHRKDPQLLLSQANFYYSSYLASNREEERHLRTSFKYYHPVLADHVRNVYAANGLAVACAEKNALDAAREIFTKIREADHSFITEDICVNLAHVHAAEQRYIDAERLYLAATKTALRSTQATGQTIAQLQELVANVQFLHGRDKEARKSFLRALHLNPLQTSLWTNIAVLCESVAADAFARGKAKLPKGENAVLAIQDELRLMRFGRALLTWCTTNTAQRMMRADPDSRKKFVQRARTCEDNIAKLSRWAESMHHLMIFNADERRRIEQEHQQKLKEREEQRLREELEKDSLKKQAQLLAQEQEKRLERMRDKWQAPAASTQDESGGGASGKKRSRKGASAANKQLSDDEDAGIPDSDIIPSVSASENMADSDDDALQDIFGSPTTEPTEHIDEGLEDSDIESSQPSKKARN